MFKEIIKKRKFPLILISPSTNCRSNINTNRSFPWDIPYVARRFLGFPKSITINNDLPIPTNEEIYVKYI